MVATGGKGVGDAGDGEGGINGDGRRLDLGDGEHPLQYTDGVLWNGTPETYIILLPKVTPINSILNKDDSDPS